VSHTLRVVVFVGILLFSLGVAGVAVADEPQHEHPDETGGDGDLAAVERWLGDNMGEIHADCTEGISVGNFDACEDLDEEYKSYLDRYVTVAGDIEGEESDERAERFNKTRRQQAELAELMQEFNRTYESYKAARAASDETRAREDARELRRLADRIRELGGEIAVNFRRLDSATSADLNTAADETEASTREVVLLTNSIEQETFETTRTNISVDQVATFRTPAVVTGTVRDSTGTPLSNATVTVSGDALQTTVKTNATGQFRASYRPTVVEAGPKTLTVNYVPDDTGKYLGSSATDTVEVRPVDSSVTLVNATAAARFSEAVRVRGRVHSGEQSVPGVLVAVSVGDDVLMTTRTDQSGTFEAATHLPANIPTGERTLSVRASEPGHAISPSRARTSLVVSPTPTNLSVNAVPTDGSNGIRITGNLTASNTDTIGERPLTISVGGDVYNATTNVDGEYALTVAASEGQHDIVVRYDEAETNLQPATADALVELDNPPADGATDTLDANTETLSSFIRNSPVLAGIAGLLVLVSAVIGLFVWRSRRAGFIDTSDDPDETIVDEGVATEAAEGDQSTALLDAAREQLDGSPKDAVQAAYAMARARLGDSSTESTVARTHWEFYHSISGDLDDERAAALRSVTEAFEQATFAPEGIDASEAAAALDDAERCLAAGNGGPTD
jgi:hypothetical protein